jgi:hypothetical protein
MPGVIHVHPGARRKFRTWYLNLPNFPASPRDLLPVYLEQVAREAIGKATGKKLPFECDVDGPFHTRFHVCVSRPQKGHYDVTILDLN